MHPVCSVLVVNKPLPTSLDIDPGREDTLSEMAIMDSLSGRFLGSTVRECPMQTFAATECCSEETASSNR